MLVELLKTLEHTPNQIASHENLRQLLRELVLAIPNAVVFRLKVLPEVWNCLCQGIFVGIDALEAIHGEFSGRELRKRIDKFRRNWSIIFRLFLFLCWLCSWFFGLLFLTVLLSVFLVFMMRFVVSWLIVTRLVVIRFIVMLLVVLLWSSC